MLLGLVDSVLVIIHNIVLSPDNRVPGHGNNCLTSGLALDVFSGRIVHRFSVKFPCTEPVATVYVRVKRQYVCCPVLGDIVRSQLWYLQSRERRSRQQISHLSHFTGFSFFVPIVCGIQYQRCSCGRLLRVPTEYSLSKSFWMGLAA